jgi:hypothetical protein
MAVQMMAAAIATTAEVPPPRRSDPALLSVPLAKPLTCWDQATSLNNKARLLLSINNKSKLSDCREAASQWGKGFA